MGVIQGGDTMQALLRLMSNLYAPQFAASSLWPESIKMDFVGKLPITADAAGHPLMKALRNRRYKSSYVPLLIYVGQLHRFLARLTETSHALNGRTVLYLPRGDMSDPVTAAADKVHSHPVWPTENPHAWKALMPGAKVFL